MLILNSRDRVMESINHRQPDRVPADIWAEGEVWARLVKDLGVATPDEVRKRLNIDVRYVAPICPPDVEKDGIRQNMWGERWAKANTPWGESWEHTDGALAGATSLEQMQAFAWPTCDDIDYSTLAEQCDRYEGYALAYGNADIFERPALVRGLETMLCDTVLNPEWVDYLTQVFLDFFIEDFTRALEATKGRIDIYWALTDLGTQSGLLVGRETFDRFIAPSIRALAELAHRESVKFMFHSCGAVRGLIPELIELGVDILNPIQPAAVGMEPEALKQDFGDKLCFHGGIDIQYLLPLETADVVRIETRRCVETLCMEGGYILSPSHNLQQDIPTANILAMYDLSIRNLQERASH
jgi:uroporphyrinogen decarboxylase